MRHTHVFPLGALVFLVAAMVVGRAQTPPSLENDFRNILSQQPSSAWPPPPPSIDIDPRTPSPRQFRAGTVIGGWQTTRVFSRDGMIYNADFELPAVDSFKYTPDTTSATWRFEGGSGVARQGAWFGVPPPVGLQAAFLQAANSAVSQSVLLNPGTYKVTFKAIGRGATPANPIRVFLTPGSTSSLVQVLDLAQSAFSATEWRSFESSQVVVSTAGMYTLRFAGLGVSTTDVATILDDVRLVLVTAPNTVAAGSASLVAGATTLILPKGTPVSSTGAPLANQGAQLEYVRMSVPMVARMVGFALGDVIPAPSFSVAGAALTEDQKKTFYLPNPVNASSERFYYSPHSQLVYATQPGVVEVTWQERASGAQITKQYVVSASPSKPVRRVYWTENGFNGPVIQIPTSRVSTVNVVYNSLFPATVAEAYVRPGEVANPSDNSNLPPEKRTLWFSTLDNALHAYNQEGRVFIEFLGAQKDASQQIQTTSDGPIAIRESLGTEIVEVVKEARPEFLRVAIGDQVLPPGGDTSLLQRVVAGLNTTAPQEPFLYQYYSAGSLRSRLFAVRQTTRLYSGGVEIPSNEVLIYWMELGGLSIQWPKTYAGYAFDWPDELSRYSLYARSIDPSADTAVQLNSGNGATLVYQDDPTQAHARLGSDYRFSTTVTAANPTGRSLIRYTNGDEIWFERVYSKLDTTFTEYAAPVSVNVGARISAPAGTSSAVGYIRTASGTAYNPGAYKNPFEVGFSEAGKGAIIGVNALPGNDELEVWWYTASTPASPGISPTLWPSVVRKYKLTWPSSPAEIVLASNAGSGDLPSLQAKGSIYTQNIRTAHGYNPNEEHALMLNGRAWALRDDLNRSDSSQAFVLVDYTEADDRPAMAVFKVLREKAVEGKVFSYTAEAGKVLQAPMPLPLLPLPTLPTGESSWASYFNAAPLWFPSYQASEVVANHEVRLGTTAAPVSADAPAKADLAWTQANDDAPRYGEFTFLDRKGTTWIYRGMHSEARTASLTMRYFYRTQEGFNFPELLDNQPAVGTVVPYIRANSSHSPIKGEPLGIRFTPVWPASAPELRVGESLMMPKYGLPAVRGQTSAEVIYQQSIAKDAAGALTSVTLHDPTRAKVYALGSGLTKIPGSAATDVYMGKTYFTRLPPHLRERFFFDPTRGAKGSLVLIGQFKDEVLGDDYLLLNRLSTSDVTALKGLVDPADSDKTAWDAAVDGLTTRLETFIENPVKKGTYVVDGTKNRDVGPGQLASIDNDDTAVDSYAVTAVGGGQGFVVMVVGNGRAFTPIDEPVSVHVFKVVPPLYRGELKVIQSANPLDEKLTLRHSSDFGGDPAGYDFEWMYAPPVDGAPPALFTYSRQLLLGDSTGWQLFKQPPPAFQDLRALETSPDANPKPAPYNTAILVATPASVSVRDTGDTADHGTTLPQAVLRKEFSITGSLPLRAYLSIELGSRDSADVYLNQAKVAVINRTGNTPTSSTPGSGYSPLRLVYEVPAQLLKVGRNVISLELYSDSDVNAASMINARLEGTLMTPTTTGWVRLDAGSGEVAGQLTGSVRGKSQHVIQGNSLLTLTDNYFTMRYRARETTNAAFVSNAGWSQWVDPQLAEGWIKRALAGINPFQQRVTNLFSNEINTDVSLVQQAGRRWEGDVALNLSNINSFGLIEIYETILRRGKGLSIEGTPAINYGAANDALLLAAGYLSDLYMIVGNEAYADAANPTIAFATDSGSAYGAATTSLFAFKGQLATVLDEELTLLRGRDNSLQPGTRITPVYNRLIWNYTRGIDSGEAIYALNYNIKDLDGDGVVGAADAAALYPQGHGDAYGHYLTALTVYYTLLANPNFSWAPRTEAVTVLGKPVAVDYMDERKFATAAVALARTAVQITDLTYRQDYDSSSTSSWEYLKDGKVTSGITRRWGVDDWAVRGWQGAFFNWVTGNSLLPAVDPDPSHEGIQKIDRTTVPELRELVSQAASLQQTLSNADGRLNPLGLSSGALAFDISAADVDKGMTHYEQIYARATQTLQNTISAFENARSSTQFLRQQEDSLAALRSVITQQEQAYTNQLIELYGSPYADDIGAGKTYVQGYSGPDLLHYGYVDVPEGLVTKGAKDFDLLLSPAFNESNPSTINYNEGLKVRYTLDSIGAMVKPSDWSGRRASPGKIQTAVSELLLARLALFAGLDQYSSLKAQMESRVAVFNAAVSRNSELTSRMETYQGVLTTIEVIQQALLTLQKGAEVAMEVSEIIQDAAATAPPTVVGLANDATSAIRAAMTGMKAATKATLGMTISGLDVGIRIQEQLKTSLARLKEIQDAKTAWTEEYQQLVYQLREALNSAVDRQPLVDSLIRRYDQADRDLRALIAQGDRIQAEREAFRKRSAALIQGYRTKDYAFRAFRDEALEKYKQLFELSARYAYLAANAYDYETGLLDPSGNAASAAFMSKIIKARSPGVLVNGVPQFGGASTGDPGLAGALAQLNGDWSVVKPRLGFTNPDRYRTTFSLRTENFRIVQGAKGDPAWREVLLAGWRENLLDDQDAARYCLNLGYTTGMTVPGFIIEFSTAVMPGLNFFGKPLLGGDSAYSISSFATKIRSTGVAFTGYVGMSGSTSTSGTLAGTGSTTPSDPYTSFTDSTALSATPYVYLIAAGVDSLRSPLDKASVVRAWNVNDQAIPLPFNISQKDYSKTTTWSSSMSLTENFTVRQHQAFRAVPDGTVFSSQPGFANARLIGRSVWNTRWKLIIPGETLLSDAKRGMQIFADQVKDIKLYLETYSTSGN